MLTHLYPQSRTVGLGVEGPTRSPKVGSVSWPSSHPRVSGDRSLPTSGWGGYVSRFVLQIRPPTSVMISPRGGEEQRHPERSVMPGEDTRLEHLPQPALPAQSGGSPPSWPGGEGKGLDETGPQLGHSLVSAASFSLHPHPHPGGTRVSASEWKRNGAQKGQ